MFLLIEINSIWVKYYFQTSTTMKSNKEMSVAEYEQEHCVDGLKKNELYLFHSTSVNLQNLFRGYKSLRRLTVIGQQVVSLEGIEELSSIEELWLVDSNLLQEKIGPLSKCTSLKRLYLYSNKLNTIPDFSNLMKLTHLWLSDNEITTLQNLNNLPSLNELHLSNNRISKIDEKFKQKLKISSLNLSGNPISNLNDMEKLSSLKKLRWLIMSDPLYRRSPVTLLANFRPHIVHSLPYLQGLDLDPITEAERKHTKAFYETKVEYYRLTLHNALSEVWASQKTTLDLKIGELHTIWSALHTHGPHIKATGNQINNNHQFWICEADRWKERKELCLKQYKKLTEFIIHKFDLELGHSGNLQLQEINLAENDMQTRIKIKCNSFICPQLRSKVLDVNLHNVWSIRGSYKITILQNQFNDNFDNVYILCPVQDLSIHPLEFLEEFLFGNKPQETISLANCFVNADSLVSDNSVVHRHLLLRSQLVLKSRLALLCGVLEGSQLANEFASSHHCPNCYILHPSHSLDIVPLYIVHFQYLFQDYFKRLKVSPATEEFPALSQSLNLKLSTQNITQLVLSNSNIHQLDVPVMEKVTSVDLSYNHLNNLSTIGITFPCLASLNVAFNRITSLENFQNIRTLNLLNLKWNALGDFLNTVKKLQTVTSLSQLDLSWNPFVDILSKDQEMYLVCKHLGTLHTYNGDPLPRSLLSNQVTLKGQFPTIPCLLGPQPPLTVCWKSELTKEPTKERSYQSIKSVIDNEIVGVTLRGLKTTRFRSVLSLNKLKWLNLSNNLISDSSSLQNLLSLEEVNLSYNVLKSFVCPGQTFKHLTKLNLSHNHIVSLNSFVFQSFPKLKLLDLSNNYIECLTGISGASSLEELYMSHNLLQECDSLVHCKSWRKLRVLDLSHTPLSHSTDFRLSCLYYLSSCPLKYINGSKVLNGETKSSMSLYGGVLDQDYLLRFYCGTPVSNLTQLTLSRCSLKKVDLPYVGINILVNVMSVTLDHNKISCLSWVEALPRLTYLNLSHNQVCGYFEKQSPSLRAQPSCGLHSLLLDHNKIGNLLPLRLDLFPNLTMLVLNDNKISTLSGLTNNCKLEQLVLDKNKLSLIRIEITKKINNLLELYLEHNSLTSLDFLQPLKKLQKLFIGFNKLVSKASLAPLGDLSELSELTVHGNPVFCHNKSYLSCLPHMPALRLLEGHNIPHQ